MSDGRLYQIYEFRSIDGTKSATPGASQDGKFPRWNNATDVVDWVTIGSGDIDETWLTNYITNVFEDSSTDDYTISASRPNPLLGTARFLRLNGGYYDLPLGELAWLDDVPIEKSGIVLPGDTKVLFDDDTAFGGEDAFTYNKGTNRLQFQGTGLMFDKTGGTEVTYKEGIRYLGNYSWSIGHGVYSSEGGSYNFSGGYRAGHPLAAGSSNNLILGTEAGYQMASNAVGNIFLGAFTGKYSNTNNEFFLDNVDHGDTATAVSDSFLYADLETERRLYIRNRLSVEAEGKFGDSGIIDGSGEEGMFQMLPVSAGVVKPQYYSNGIWNDFANSTDTYLDDFDLTDGILTLILSDLSEVGPIDLTSVNTTTFATSPSSPATGQTATSDYGYIQISNSAFTNNEGFTYKAGFSYNNTTSELNVPGAVKLSQIASDALFSNGAIWQNGTHGYIKIGGTSIQIDNDANNGEINTGVNVGSGDVNWFKQKNANNELEFRSFNLWSYDSTWNPHNRLTQSTADDGDTIILGTTAELNYLETTVGTADDRRLDRPKDGEMLPLRALRQGTGCTLTQTEEYILIDATGAGGGEVNTASNLGTGIEFFAYKNSADLEFFTLETSDARIVLTQATDRVTDQENAIDLDLGFDSADAAVVGAGEASLKATITGTGITGDLYTFTHKKLTSPLASVTITETATEIQLETGAAAATGTNLGAQIEVYKGSAPDFEFKTINAEGQHITVEANADAETIDFIVDDIVWTDTTTAGTDVFLIEQGVDSFEFTQRSLQGAGGIEIQDNASVIVNQPILIPKFSFTTTPVFTPGTPITQGLLAFKSDYDADVRDGDTLVATTMFELNVGAGLSYNSGTNTLSSVTAGGSASTDYYLTSAGISTVGTNYVLSFVVGDALVPDSLDTYTVNVPIYQPTIATYGDNVSPLMGNILVDKSQYVWDLDTTQQLSLDELTGTLSVAPMIVTYDSQNTLHDADIVSVEDLVATPPVPSAATIISRRDQARANIGAAYIEGKSTVDFNAKDLTVANILDAHKAGVEHSIGSLNINTTALYGTTVVSIGPNLTAITNETSAIKVGTSVTRMYIPSVASGGKVQIWGNPTGSAAKLLFKLDAEGNMYVRGNIYSDQDIEAFSDETDALA